MTDFTGKAVLITGASSGLGRQLAVDFARDGAKVAINYASSDDGARTTLSEVEKAGGTGLLCKADISRLDEVSAMVEQVVSAFGGIDILVNSAGLSIDQPFLEMAEEAWDRVIAVNLKGPFLVGQAVGRHMVAAGHGRIVNISATTAIVARAGNANYAASKGGVNLLTQSMALELGPAVNVNGVALGMVDSDLVRELFSPEAIKEAEDGVPLKRLTTYEETSAFVRMLASDATGFVTGQTIPFDGGRVMR
ncbi:SDR family oxidoreductase [Nisaea acidiphila]|uniref:SDR family oxidoreductase n=1 Tax=Nisaea acidiphila TaxID=1862145 RepID=A0A9J7AQU5_9PROT|nr:SDR family NAD(P)-dependent oxidoreductase [Nisaea acidiphila]UUX49607.1 SDR family oxidoreductase [Nisaea acidiphila]